MCIREARADNRALAIIALSIGNGGIEQKAIDAGADEYVSKQYLATSTWEYLGKKLLAALREHDREPLMVAANVLALDLDDFELAATVEVVGRSTIVNCTTRAIRRRCTKIVPYYVRSGLSGAPVLRVDCQLETSESQAPEERSLILKLSTDENSLTNEVGRDLSSFPDELFVRYITPKPVRSGGWFALVASYRGTSTLLADICNGVGQKKAESSLDALFMTSGLCKTYQRAGLVDERPNVYIWKSLMTLSRKARIRQAMYELAGLIAKYDPGIGFDERAIQSFLASKRFGEVDEETVPSGAASCWSHGDLHGRNVLMTTLGPRLIDPANVKQRHWASDIARLAADILVSGLDWGDASHEWHHMKSWCSIARAFTLGKTMPPESRNETVVSALMWLRQNLWTIHGGNTKQEKCEWEFRLALATELLRCSYRIQELPSPKRVFSLLAASEALTAASAAYADHAKTA